MKIIIVLYLLFAATPGGYEQPDVKAKKILEEVSEKTRSYKNISADFVFTMENKEIGINEKNEGSIKMNGKKYVVDLPEIGVKIFSDGVTIWNYMEDGNQVTISNMEDQSDEFMDPSSLFNIHEKDYRSKFSGEKNKGDKVLYQIELLPDKQEGDISKIIIYIDKSEMMISSALFFGMDGNLYGIEVKKIETNIDLPDSFFVFNAGDFGDIEIIDFR